MTKSRMAKRGTPSGRRAASRAADAVSKLPVCSVNPAVTGTTTQGSTLTCTTGTWSKSPAFTYQWFRSLVAVAGATANTRVLAAGDVGGTMTCTVTATKSGVSAVATSNTTATIT